MIGHSGFDVLSVLAPSLLVEYPYIVHYVSIELKQIFPECCDLCLPLEILTNVREMVEDFSNVVGFEFRSKLFEFQVSLLDDS